MPDPTTTLLVAKPGFTFSAAHFLTIPGHVCERLHGHNYRVGVQVDGPVDPATGFVLDFADVKQAVHRIIDRMDHRVLLPSRSDELIIREGNEQIEIDYGRPAWMVIPKAHACLVPVQHTTAELLAQHIAEELWKSLRKRTAIERLEVELEESPGQGARAGRVDG